MKFLNIAFQLFSFVVSCFLLYPEHANARGSLGVSKWEETLLDELEQFEGEKAERQSWHLDRLLPVREDVQYLGDEVIITWNVYLHYRMNFDSAQDVPVIRGKRAFMTRQMTTLDAQHRQAALANYREWRDAMEVNIDSGVDTNERVQIRAERDPDGVPRPETLAIYLENALGQFEPADSVFERIPTPAELEFIAYQDMMAVFGPLAPINEMMPSGYNGTGAASYANSWTSSATAKVDCGKDSNGNTIWIAQDTSKYNKNYSYWKCTDCANFVSQAMKENGIPTDNTWKPYTDAWVGVSKLISWGTGTRKWTTVTSTTYSLGDIVRLDPNTASHVMMTTALTCPPIISAHTNDKKSVTYNPSSKDIFYHVK